MHHNWTVILINSILIIGYTSLGVNLIIIFESEIKGFISYIKSKFLKYKNKEKFVMAKLRFAPSNTGGIHLGSIRSALLNYAYAKKMGGKLLLRFEDSDPKRSTDESMIDIMEGLEWVGIEFDNGPKLSTLKKTPGKKSKEFFQSKRSDIYAEHVDHLLKTKQAYVDKENVVLFKMPEKDFSVYDQILGPVLFPRSENKDFAIRRADGSFLFHLCMVVDDIENRTTLILRGNDHLTNTVKHIALFEAFGKKVPDFGHMPLILDDKGEKLSKRRTDQFVLIKDFKANGYLPDTIVNMCGILGWSKAKDVQDFDLGYLCSNFDIKDSLKTNPRYDPKLMLQINFRKMKHLTIPQFVEKLHKYGEDYYPNIVKWFDEESEKFTFEQFAKLYFDRSKTLKDPFINCKFLMNDDIMEVEDDILTLIKENPTYEYIDEILDLVWRFDYVNNNIVDSIKDFAKNKSIKFVDVVQLIRMCLTMDKVSPPIDITILALGRDTCKRRINSIVNSVEVYNA